MPLYEYQCQQCKERVEIIQRMSDPPSSHCPKCGGEMKKLISSPAIQFKGGVVEGRAIGADQVKDIAALPSREELIAKLLFLVQSPISRFVVSIASSSVSARLSTEPLRQCVRRLDPTLRWDATDVGGRPHHLASP